MFPPTLSQFVRGAEIHGDLAQSLSRLAEIYEERSDLKATQLRMALMILTNGAIGLMVLFLMYSLFMPLFRFGWL